MWIIMGDILYLRYAYDRHLTSSNTELKPIITMSCWESKMLNSKNSIKLYWPRFEIFDAIKMDMGTHFHVRLPVGAQDGNMMSEKPKQIETLVC